jgi:hypothetical protein
MVEGGRINHGHHDGKPDYALLETVEFARADPRRLPEVTTPLSGNSTCAAPCRFLRIPVSSSEKNQGVTMSMPSAVPPAVPGGSAS